jgi:nucleoid-associated protein YgaU
VAAKAYLMTEKNVKIPCMFNPAELQISRSNSWSGESQRGVDAPELVFGGGEAATMGLDLMFDTTAEGKPVTNYTNKLLDLMKIDTSLSGYDEAKTNGRPPWVKFHWGDMHSFKAIIESVDIRFTYFSSTGMPMRASVDMSLKQFEPDANWGPQNPTSGTPHPHRVHRVQKGETLDRISARHYGDSTKWRLIAEANGITDPLALRPGAFLNIPKQQV